MEEFWILILVLIFATNSLDKAESVQLFDEIFGEGWWDNDKADEWDKLTLEQNFLHQIDWQNTQIGQIEPNSTDQNHPFTESDHSGQIEPNSTDQNPPLTESDQLGQIKHNSTDQNPPLTDENEIASNKNIAENERKRKIVDKFHAMKADFKHKRKSDKEMNWASVLEQFTLGKANLARPNQTKNSPTANRKI
uniref:Uncharacterized protein n=1 Tax=Globodera rostochiensis TaxID=31243 RepID=A0A914H1F3_GLORO